MNTESQLIADQLTPADRLLQADASSLVDRGRLEAQVRTCIARSREQKELPCISPWVEFVSACIDALPFEDASFDAVISNGVINLSSGEAPRLRGGVSRASRWPRPESSQSHRRLK
jgi:hypothetical protein